MFSKRKKAFTQLVLLVFLKGVLSAARVVRLSCDVTALPGGLYQYQLSPEPGPDCDEQGWEDHNKTALTRGCNFDPDLVHNLTNQILVLKKCLNFTHFSAQCPGFLEANCTFNCSSVRAASVVNPPKNESDVLEPQNNVCFGDRCFDSTHFALTCSAVLFILLLAIAGLWGFYKYKKRRGQRNLQRRVEELDQPQKDQGVLLQELKPLPNQTNPDAPDNALLSAVRVE